MQEKNIESHLRNRIREIGGIAYKFNSPKRRAVPDRMCCLPYKMVVFVECKAPGRKLTPAQAREIQRLKDMGFVALVIDSKEKVEKLIEYLERQLSIYREEDERLQKQAEENEKAGRIITLN